MYLQFDSRRKLNAWQILCGTEQRERRSQTDTDTWVAAAAAGPSCPLGLLLCWATLQEKQRNFSWAKGNQACNWQLSPPLSLSFAFSYPVNHHLLMPVYFLAVYAAACYLFARRSRPSWPTLKSNFNDQCTRLHIRLAYMPIINNARCHAHPPQPFSARPCVDINEL